MKAGDLVLRLDLILSLVAIEGSENSHIPQDYLLDSVRRGHLPFDLNWVHETAATYLLRHKIEQAACSTFSFDIPYLEVYRSSRYARLSTFCFSLLVRVFE